LFLLILHEWKKHPMSAIDFVGAELTSARLLYILQDFGQPQGLPLPQNRSI